MSFRQVVRDLQVCAVKPLRTAGENRAGHSRRNAAHGMRMAGFFGGLCSAQLFRFGLGYAAAQLLPRQLVADDDQATSWVAGAGFSNGE